MPSITQLEYVIAVEKHGHFAKAAEACHVTQPTLSQQIAKLEDELSLIIFDRLKKPIILTPEGRRFFEQAKAVVSEHEKLINITKFGMDGLAGEFRLAIIPTISSFLLPIFIESFSKKFPQIELYLEELPTDTILSELKADRLDGAILATPLNEKGFKEHPLYYEPMYLYLSPDHPLKKKSKITPEDLDASSIWMLKDGNCFKTQVANYCSIDTQSDSVLKNIHFQSGSLETLRNIVRNSRGVTLIPALMLKYLTKSELESCVRPFKDPAPYREVSFIYRRDHWKLEIIQAIKDLVMQLAPKEVSKTKNSKMEVLEIC